MNIIEFAEKFCHPIKLSNSQKKIIDTFYNSIVDNQMMTIYPLYRAGKNSYKKIINEYIKHEKRQNL